MSPPFPDKTEKCHLNKFCAISFKNSSFDLYFEVFLYFGNVPFSLFREKPLEFLPPPSLSLFIYIARTRTEY